MGDKLSGPGGRERRGVKDGNDRIARIARFLSTPIKNPNVAELVLTLLGEDEEVLARWPKEDASTELAYQIDSMLLDAANDAATTIDARLAWVTNEGVSWLSKNFRARCDATAQENVRPLDGTMQSMLQQNQRHLEAVMVQLASITHRQDERFTAQLGIFTSMQEMLMGQVARSEARAYEAEEREQQTLELADAAAGQAEEAAAEAAAAVTGKDDAMGKVIEIAARQLMSGAASGPAK